MKTRQTMQHLATWLTQRRYWLGIAAGLMMPLSGLQADPAISPAGSAAMSQEKERTVLQDPTAPFGEVATTHVDKSTAVLPELEGIMQRGNADPIAIINQQAVGVGEWVDGFQVMAITAEQVWLMRQAQQIQLSLYPAIKQLSSPDD